MSISTRGRALVLAFCAAAIAIPAVALAAVGDLNGKYSSGKFKPKKPGTYRWTASYSGDASNKAAVESCNSPHEKSVVKKR